MALKPTNTYQVSIYKEPRKLQKSKSLKIKRTINILVTSEFEANQIYHVLNILFKIKRKKELQHKLW